jgi:hypothetical protein
LDEFGYLLESHMAVSCPERSVAGIGSRRSPIH